MGSACTLKKEQLLTWRQVWSHGPNGNIVLTPRFVKSARQQSLSTVDDHTSLAHS